MRLKSWVILFIGVAVSVTCDANTQKSQFSEYWEQGKAEISVYDLKQTAYGVKRAGKATLIFVTEPFSRKNHVKRDSPNLNPRDTVRVLKLNLLKEYITGIYPYSIMTSAFLNLAKGHIIKANTSVQEWCGNTFMQVNQRGAGTYNYTRFSYFEQQGDSRSKIKANFLYEGLMLRARLGSISEIPSFTMLPSQELTRLLLIPYQTCSASIEVKVEGVERHYLIRYQHEVLIDTMLRIEIAFPYRIMGWKDRYRKAGKIESNSTQLVSSQRLPYWEMSSPADLEWRKKIGLQ